MWKGDGGGHGLGQQGWQVCGSLMVCLEAGSIWVVRVHIWIGLGYIVAVGQLSLGWDVEIWSAHGSGSFWFILKAVEGRWATLLVGSIGGTCMWVTCGLWHVFWQLGLLWDYGFILFLKGLCYCWWDMFLPTMVIPWFDVFLACTAAAIPWLAAAPAWPACCYPFLAAAGLRPLLSHEGLHCGIGLRVLLEFLLDFGVYGLL
ncbi:hypothetical protein E3N88_07383 [Mikania micrantha]|uniref:Uncharacterized protein n=1 Tax=Mikania micrantha TaxID=192012 RepID=A0A5N6PTI3_9ASTR|nr:hypothetical protein E3N88_07383 [Mikania micrantha]